MRPALTAALVALGVWCVPAAASAQQQESPCPRDAAREAMHADMAEWDQRLEAKLAEVERARGDRKVQALTDVVRELVAQRRTMHQRMMEQHAAGCPMHGGPAMQHGAGGPPQRPCPQHPAAAPPPP